MAANNDPRKSDETLIILQPSSRLCARCASSRWPSTPSVPEQISLPGYVSQSLQLHKTFYSLQESADQGCALCQFAWLSLVKRYTSTHAAESSLNNGSVELFVDIYCGDSVRMSSNLVHEGQRISTGASAFFAPVESSEAELSELELLGSMKSRHLKDFNRENVQKELEELVYDQIRPWMDSCREQHADHTRCGAKYVSSTLPTRLLDVGKTNSPSVKLVEVKNYTNFGGLEYLILSYCWGHGNENSKTTQSNLEVRLQGFAVSVLSKTIQDAILLTRLMGFQYLWVDAICIIQGPSGDFHSESPRMGDYYSNAACCISASVAKDSQEGFLIERPLARFPLNDIAIKLVNYYFSWRNHTFKAINNSPNVFYDVLNSPLAERGWCLQETALSNRILHWTLQGLYLECQSSLFPEGSKVPCKRQSTYAGPTAKDIMAMPDKDILFSDGWYQLVSIFSETQLTHEADRLYAIHGLASILIQRLKVQYFNGLFRPSLAHGLLWYHGSGWLKAYERPRNTDLPSWCWAYSCPITFEHICQTPVYVKDDHPERPLQFPTHSEALAIVESTAMRLYFRAPIFQLTIGRTKVAYMKNDCSGHSERFRCDYNLDANRHVMQGMPRRPSQDGGWGQGVDVFWLPIGRSARVYSSLVGLLVHEVPDEGTGAYCRYGILIHHGQGDSIINEEHLREVKEITLI